MPTPSPLKYRIKLDEDISLAELKAEISKGGRFKVFPYCISLVFAVTLKRISPAFFIRKGDSHSEHSFKYNLISYLCGWWCIPWGPFNTLNYIKINKKGGLDVTEDIMQNITEEGLENRVVELAVIHLLYNHPDETDIKAIKKAVFKKMEGPERIKKMLVGEKMNRTQNDPAGFVIGLSVKGDFGLNVELLRQALYTQFFKHIQFEILNLDEDSETNNVLLQQGTVVM